MNQLQQLIERCKSSASITANQHRDFYESATGYLAHCNGGDMVSIGEDLSREVYDKMIATDTIIEVQFYPHTPIGFHIVYHYDLEAALNRAIEILNNEQL